MNSTKESNRPYRPHCPSEVTRLTRIERIAQLLEQIPSVKRGSDVTFTERAYRDATAKARTDSAEGAQAEGGGAFGSSIGGWGSVA